MCTEWMVSPCDQLPKSFTDRSLWKEDEEGTSLPDDAHSDASTVARTHTEWRTHAHIACLFCGEVTRESVVVNPFAPRCVVSVCASCQQRLT